MPDRFTAGTVTNSTEMGRPATRGFRGAHPTGVQTQTPEQGVHPHVRIWDRSQGKNWAQRHPQAAGLGPPSSLGLQAAVGVGWARERCLKPKLAATCFSLPSLISSRQRNFCLPGTVGGQPTPNPDGHCFVATLWTSHLRSGTSDIWTGERGLGGEG